jgi:hypothetical protein
MSDEPGDEPTFITLTVDLTMDITTFINFTPSSLRKNKGFLRRP